MLKICLPFQFIVVCIKKFPRLLFFLVSVFFNISYDLQILLLSFSLSIISCPDRMSIYFCAAEQEPYQPMHSLRATHTAQRRLTNQNPTRKQ